MAHGRLAEAASSAPPRRRSAYSPEDAIRKLADIRSALGARDLPEPWVEERWPPRRTFAFVMLTCGGFWALVGGAAYWLFG